MLQDLRNDACAAAAGLRCLACGTASPSAARHRSSHRGKRAAGHELALDLACGEVFCTACGDFVYDSELDRAVMVRVNTPPRNATAEAAAVLCCCAMPARARSALHSRRFRLLHDI
jgi:hypothetical protein